MYKKICIVLFLLLLASSSFAFWPFGDTKNFFIIDKNVTDQNITQTFGADLNWSQLNIAVPWADVNILNSTRFRQDASCDNNANCIIIGDITGAIGFQNDTNAQTACSGSEYLAGDGTCKLISVTGDLNWTQLNTVVPWQDVNVADDITVSNYLRNAIWNAQWPLIDANILNADRFKQDASCDNNSSCSVLEASLPPIDLNWVALSTVIPWADSNIDFGLGANQVSAIDIPIDDGNDFFVGTNVEDALQDAGLDLNKLNKFFSGTIDESFSATATSDGATVTMNLTGQCSGNLKMNFTDGETLLDVSPALTISLTAGSDASPTENFIFIPFSTKTLTKSTSDWPTEQHIRIGYFFVPSAGFVQTNGTYVNQNWNEDKQDCLGQGDDSHIGERIRRLGAQYFTGVAGSGTDGYLTPTALNTELSSTAGIVYQKHAHTINSFDTADGNVVLVKNWSGDSFHAITNLFDITADSTGASIGNNKYFNLTIWKVANETGEFVPTLINLPSGFYNSQSDAENDVDGFDDFTMPAEFNTQSSTGFLVARVTIQMKTAGTWLVTKTVDLRGTNPQTATGTAAGVIVEFSDNEFKIHDESDASKEMAFDVGTLVTTGNTRTIKIPDSNGTMALLETNNYWTAFNDFNAFGTGDVLANEFDAQFGNDVNGAIKIGNLQIAKLGGIGTVGDMNVDAINIFRRMDDGDNNILFLFANETEINFALAKPLAELAAYIPRSFMVGGDLGNAYDDGIINCISQGYTFIDCATNITGADLGIQDDLEVHGSISVNRGGDVNSFRFCLSDDCISDWQDKLWSGDFNGNWDYRYDSKTMDVDGGFANSVYLLTQKIDGEGA